jgi:hypothetical protein
MNIKFRKLVGLLVVLGMVASLVTLVAAPASAIDSVVVNNDPTAAGAAAKWTVSFTAEPAGAAVYTPGADTFTITFPALVTMPAGTTISKSAITVKTTEGGGHQGTPALDADIDGQEVTVTLPAVDLAGDAFPEIGHDGNVTIIIAKGAGIKNPAAVNTGWVLGVSGSYTGGTEIMETGTFNTTVPTNKITLTPAKGARNSSVKVSGTGFAPGYTAKISVEGVVLGYADVSSTGTFSKSFIVSKPPFITGDNTISAEDGSGLPAATAEFGLRAGITLKPTSGRPGDCIKITGTDTEGSGAAVVIGGNQVDDCDGDPLFVPALPWDGAEGVLEFTIPGGLSPGKVKVMLWDDNGPGEAGLVTADLTILGMPVTVEPDSGGPYTKVVISGSGFSKDSHLDEIQIGGQDWMTGDVLTTSAGTFTTQITLTPAIWNVLGAGNWSVYVEDHNGRVGLSEYEIPQPTLTLNIEESGIGSTLIATGTGFSVRKMFTIYYGGDEDTGEMVLNGTTSSTGTFTAGFKVPATYGPDAEDVMPGEEYQVYVEDTVGVEAIATHTVSTGTVAVTPDKAQWGATITVSLSGFQPFAKVVWAELDEKDILPSADQWTDSKGKVTFATKLPGSAAIGPTVVMVGVGGDDGDTTSSTAFTVLEAPVTVGDALESVISKVVIVWGYVDGKWYMYDPTDLTDSTLTSLGSGNGYWIKVSLDCQLIYGAFTFDLKAAYWNNVGWP